MGLINLKTSLKSLTFGHDVQGGGSSGLPYIKAGLPEDSPAGEYLAGIERTSADWPLRGGAYSTIASTTDTVRISRFLTDFPRGSIFTAKQVGLQKSNPNIETGGLTSRLNTQTYNLNANLLAQVLLEGDGTHIPRAGANTNELGPEGQKNKYEYIVSHKDTNQNRLVALYGTKIQQDSTGIVVNSALSKLGIPDDENTLFDYPGGPDSLYGDGNTFISRVVNTNSALNTPDKGEINYLDTLGVTDYIKVNKIAGLSGGVYKPKKNPFSSTAQTFPPANFNTTNNAFSKTDPFKANVPGITPVPLPAAQIFSTTENIDFSHDAFSIRPKSLYQQSSPDYIRPDKVPEDMPTTNQFGNLMGYNALLASKTTSGPVTTQKEIQDFRSQSLDPNNPTRFQARNYNNPLINIETRVGIGNPGGRKPEQMKYINQVNYKGQDQVNMIPLYSDAEDPFNNKPEARDLIKFAFEVISNDSTGTGKQRQTNGEVIDVADAITTKVHFRAFLTDFSDNHGAEWSGQKYMGRGENFYSYQGFTREVSFQFKVAAQSKQEMLPLWQKLNYIVSSLYPDYQEGTSFMRGNLHRLTIGEYFYRTPGIIKSMNISVDTDYPWEIKYSEPETQRSFTTKDFPNNTSKGSTAFENSNSDADMMELPQVINVTCTFTPILNELPQLSKLTKTGGGKHILISNHGLQENFINRIENIENSAPEWNKSKGTFNPVTFNVNAPNT
jgi:hypothetical protein